MTEDVSGYKILAASIIVRAMKDSVSKTTGSTKGRSDRTLEDIRANAESWLRDSLQCKVYLDWLDWPCSGDDLAELAKDGARWTLIAHTISRALVA